VKRLAVLAACLLLLGSCRRAEAPKAEKAPPPGSLFDKATLRVENDNLLNLAFGASVIDRQNEGHFEVSAAHAIDGTAMTPWISAPGGPIGGVFSLPAPSRIDRLGVMVDATQSKANVTLHFETSLDGTTWTKAADLPLTFTSSAPQLANANVTAQYIRIALDSPDYEKSILSLYAIGRETAPPVQPPLDGCWEINGQPARFTGNGARVAGVIGSMAVVGGTDGRVFRLMWLDHPQWGFAAVTTGADGQHLSGVRWHEEVNPKHNGDGWFGRRVPCASDALVDNAKVVDHVIRRTGFWRMYGVRFDAQDRLMAADSADALDLAAQLVREHPQHRFRLIAREFRAANEQENRARSQRKLDAVRDALKARNTDLSRIELVNAGTQISELNIPFTSQQAMDSGIDLMVVPR
jgi:hypothetical protein